MSSSTESRFRLEERTREIGENTKQMPEPDGQTAGASDAKQTEVGERARFNDKKVESKSAGPQSSRTRTEYQRDRTHIDRLNTC